MTTLTDVVEANRILVALGGEDQMQRIAAASIERSLELQNRIDRALAYAESAPANSMHARNIARILDGSITVDDELAEVAGNDHVTRRLQLHPAADAAQGAVVPAPVKRTRGPNKKKLPGLQGRSTSQRKEFREWAAAQGLDLPKNGRSPDFQGYVDAYDDAMEEERKRRVAARKASQRQPPEPLRSSFDEPLPM
jgi:hypothetical protein